MKYARSHWSDFSQLRVQFPVPSTWPLRGPNDLRSSFSFPPHDFSASTRTQFGESSRLCGKLESRQRNSRREREFSESRDVQPTQCRHTLAPSLRWSMRNPSVVLRHRRAGTEDNHKRPAGADLTGINRQNYETFVHPEAPIRCMCLLISWLRCYLSWTKNKWHDQGLENVSINNIHERTGKQQSVNQFSKLLVQIS